MTVSFNNFINSARKLSIGSDEIDYRNAASRAYYAVYHEARRVSVCSNGNTGLRTGIHQKLCEKLKTHTGSNKKDSDIRKIGINLAMCKKERVKADYKINLTYSKVDALKTIQQADSIIRLSANFP